MVSTQLGIIEDLISYFKLLNYEVIITHFITSAIIIIVLWKLVFNRVRLIIKKRRELVLTSINESITSREKLNKEKKEWVNQLHNLKIKMNKFVENEKNRAEVESNNILLNSYKKKRSLEEELKKNNIEATKKIIDDLDKILKNKVKDITFLTLKNMLKDDPDLVKKLTSRIEEQITVTIKTNTIDLEQDNF